MLSRIPPVIRRRWPQIMLYGFGNPLVYCTVFALMHIPDIWWPARNPFFGRASYNTYPMSGLGLLVFFTLCFSGALLLLRYKIWIELPAVTEEELVRRHRKAVPAYIIGVVISFLLMTGMEGNVIGFVLIPLILLQGIVFLVISMIPSPRKK